MELPRSGARHLSSICTQSRKKLVIAEISAADCVRKTMFSEPIVWPSPLLRSTSYLTVGRYLYDRLDLSDIVDEPGAKNGTNSRVGVISSSMASKISFQRRSGVGTETYSAKIWLTSAERFVPIRWASASTSRTTSSDSVRL